MFASFELPFYITVAVFGVGLLVASFISRREKTYLICLAVSFFLFVPSCTGVMLIVDQFRYGRFDYLTESEVPRDGYIELPPTATHIVLYRNRAGHCARFGSSTELLMSWVAEVRARHPSINMFADKQEHLKRFPEGWLKEIHKHESNVFAQRFPNTGWTYDPEMIELRVNRSRHGDSFTLWHLPSTGDTYLSAQYW